LTREEPQSNGELFDELEQFSKEYLKETKQDRAIEEQDGGFNSKPHETSIMWKTPHHSSTKTTCQAQEGVFCQEEEEGEEELRKSKTMIQEIHTFTVDITEEVIALIPTQKPKRM
jgi:hypothetical protein